MRDFLVGYVACALWTGVEPPEGHPFAGLDKLYSIDDRHLTRGARARMRRQCRDFCRAAGPLLRRAYARPGYTAERAGHDFWLTRNGHGAGFWDRSELERDGIGDELSWLSNRMGECYLYVGDDRKVHLM